MWQVVLKLTQTAEAVVVLLLVQQWLAELCWVSMRQVCWAGRLLCCQVLLQVEGL
jgi:hypothetical protein